MSRRNLEQLKADCKAITQLLNILDTLNEKIKNHQTQDHKSELAKRVQGITEYQYRQRSVLRNPDNDRVVPIETIDREQFRLKYAAQLSNVTLHYGEYSDELTRSMNLLALTIGTDIYFRNGAYKPETEEGRALLAHELTHVAQNKEDIPEAQRPVHELEKEAAAAEKSAEYNPEKYRELIFKDKTYTVSQRKYKQIMQAVKYNVQYALEHNTLNLQEKEYLKFLAAFTSMEKNGELIWQK